LPGKSGAAWAKRSKRCRLFALRRWAVLLGMPAGLVVAEENAITLPLNDAALVQPQLKQLIKSNAAHEQSTQAENKRG
jgi:hypothetical protein